MRPNLTLTLLLTVTKISTIGGEVPLLAHVFFRRGGIERMRVTVRMRVNNLLSVRELITHGILRVLTGVRLR